MRTTTAAAALLAVGGLVAVTARPAAKPYRQPRDGGPRKRVVVVGAGFGGLQAAMGLAGRPGIDLTVIDMHNHHLFQPLLYQVATGSLAPTDICAPVRDLMLPSSGVHVFMETVTGIDTKGKRVLCGEREVPYDELVVATGSKPSYFGHKAWPKAARGLKTLDDALALRQQIMTAFEAAALAETEAERDRALTFVCIGGGPTGVEMAGSIAELAHDMLARDYNMPGARARVIVVDADEKVLGAFAPHLSDYTLHALQGLGVEVRTGTKVTELEPGRVHLDGDVIEAGVVIWAAGTEATPVAKWLGVQPTKGGLVEVGPDLRVPGLDGVRVIGDAALARKANGHKLPALAPVAKQQGEYVARAIRRGVTGGRALPSFRYKDYGNLATIGRNRAVAELGPVHMKGAPAWLVWAVAHIFFLIGFRNRVLVATQWFFSYLLNQRSGRLITGPGPHKPRQPPVAKPGYKVMPPSTNKVAPVT